MHPFEIFFDKDSQKYYMFLPDGSVMVDSINCECDERGEDLNVALNLDPENLPEKLYGHVTVEFEGDGEERKVKSRKVRFDGKESDDAEDGGFGSDDESKRFDFVVCSFGKEENDGLQYDVVTSAIFLALNPKANKWAEPKATIAYGGDEDEAPSVSLTVEDELSGGTSEDGGVAEDQELTGKKQLNLDIKLEKPVLTLNGLRGAVEIEGGNKISVTVEDQKIKISYDEKKPEEGEEGEEGENKDPCDHDSSGDAGGVKFDDETHSGGGEAVGGGGEGGVPADGEPHVGDDDCNCK